MRPARIHQHDHRPQWQLAHPLSALRMTARRSAPPRSDAPSGGAGIRRHFASVVPVLIIAAVAVLALAGGTGMSWLPLLAVGPALAAATSGPWGVLRIGALAVGLGAAVGVHAGTPDRELAIVLSALSALSAVTLASSLAGALRRRREQVLAQVRSVAEAAQHAFLKPVPATVGHFQAAVRYSAAAAEARIGGDLYALVPTPFGIRLIVGDVRGKGLPAVGVAALVLGVFREAAYDEPDLLDVVHRIERSLARNLGPDDFVTAVIAGYPDADRMELVNCGHAAPLLVQDSRVLPVEPARPAPPLGLRALADEAPSLQEVALADGNQLLFYTDGVTEARDHEREFYPLSERLAVHLSEDPSRTLAALHEDLLTHVGGELHDDAALLLLRRPCVGPAGAGRGAAADEVAAADGVGEAVIG
ncbi:PP2C family protein-serine/threonine phosphatase [Streptomyces tubercidicus]|uniref:PP2C family protein-serine/threonine phosphatase n=1 Tax=Streptomyces tubercidicus TaxID=47759 RepID=UPI0022B78DD8|nr:PP2C family protein-serine/threonine phosphatase [Streptomyces tubercidicus]WAU10129.1 serine/threonine-protein phosphatase [Streptomyces tubercidicus]